MVTAPGSSSSPGPSANVGIWDAAESRSHARAGCGSRSMGGCRPRITRVQSPHGHGSSAASVVPSRLRGARWPDPGTGRRPAGLTCGSGTGPAPATHRRPAVRPLPRRTAPGPPHLAAGPRPAPMPAPPRPRAAARQPPAALRTATDTSAPPPGGGRRNQRPRSPRRLQCWYLTPWYGCAPAGWDLREIRRSVVADAR